MITRKGAMLKYGLKEEEINHISFKVGTHRTYKTPIYLYNENEIFECCADKYNLENSELKSLVNYEKEMKRMFENYKQSKKIIKQEAINEIKEKEKLEKKVIKDRERAEKNELKNAEKLMKKREREDKKEAKKLSKQQKQHHQPSSVKTQPQPQPQQQLQQQDQQQQQEQQQQQQNQQLQRPSENEIEKYDIVNEQPIWKEIIDHDYVLLFPPLTHNCFKTSIIQLVQC
ncbi:hypothetical protein ACTFIW_010811 [Dictyostelium discoideum]